MTDHTPALPRVLSIAGTDPTGGAGIQADIKSIGAAGGFAMTVVTALVAQNTHGVRSIHTPDSDFLVEQLDAVFDDATVDAVKIGMLGTAEITNIVTDYLAAHPVPVIVVDPVMVATSGDRLLTEDAEAALVELCRAADVITPNLAELAVLCGSPKARDLDVALDQGRSLAADLGTTVIVKGGHLSGPVADNAVVGPDGTVTNIPVPRVETNNTHGTGCSLSSALATRLAAGDSHADGLRWTSGWLAEAIRYADDLHVGTGNGPVDHTHRARRLAAAADTTPWALTASVPSVLERPEQLAELVPVAANDARITAAGPWTQALWQASSGLLDEICALPFITDLAAGTVSADDFSFYLAQDALYLSLYSPALAALAASAPDQDAALFWTKGAAECLEEEAELHRTWLAGEHGDSAQDGQVTPSHVTASYTSHLMRCVQTRDHVVGAAAVLPCYWLYAEVGLRLSDISGTSDNSNPYAAWIDTYSGEDFTGSVEQALSLVENALESATPVQRSEAARAYLDASRWEVEFFAQADRRLP
ncbi:MAG TPA: bifunctional hydroxymethylpyrimidine kinase/phosphomethylpyrimidine kinase [Candidatus Corynebacterium avicola]|uniref:Thiamine biosynthesis multifunctional protein ThiED n=1 Tax=Candidatus Corynebacterium avicola TaxID=2838527 RepID=A0A9D1ULV8_9CORY|nr:bifunctional hydroxymethylpyrimidine kinase/phosphomethylpyrimidine kinase [Candidatus Corynebacterium avicola]